MTSKPNAWRLSASLNAWRKPDVWRLSVNILSYCMCVITRSTTSLNTWRKPTRLAYSNSMAMRIVANHYDRNIAKINATQTLQCFIFSINICVFTRSVNQMLSDYWEVVLV